MEVVFFPNLPFMGVMLFSSFALGNAFGEGGTFLLSLSLFSILLSLPLLSSLSPSPSFSLPSFLLFPHLILPFFLSSFLPHLILPLSHKLLPSLFSSSPLFHLVFLSSFLLEGFFFFFFFFFEGAACTVYFQVVMDDATDCN